MRVVSNTSPLLNLAAIGKADLLTKLFGLIIAPEVVREEINALHQRDPRFAAADLATVATFVLVNDRNKVALLSLHLDRGEAEAIALAAELNADLLLVDERRATRTAHQLGLKTLGLLGVLLLAKRKGHIAKVAPLLDRLESEAGFWIGQLLHNQVLSAAGE
jgi:predicted nucleic acid-binding protein